MPLSDRDYMKRRSPPPPRRPWSPGGFDGFTLNPVLVIIIINLVFFLATWIRSDLRTELGLVPVLFTEKPWTIITSMFIHAGFWHLFGNMITLFYFGSFLTRLIGQNWFILLYFVGGILGNALFLGMNMSLPVLVIGASGAVYAIAGALVVMVPRLRVALWGILPMPLWMVVVVFFVIFSFIPGVAWQAHLGGLATGAIAGLFFRKRVRVYFY